jgi:hypothetical protein
MRFVNSGGPRNNARKGGLQFDAWPAVVAANPEAGRRRVLLLGEKVIRSVALERRDGRFEHGPQAVKVRLAQRIVFVVVALGAAHLQAQQYRADGGRHFVEHDVPPLDLVVDIGHVGPCEAEGRRNCGRFGIWDLGFGIF